MVDDDGMRWTLLYQSSDPTEAYLIRDYLSQRGLRSQLRGQDLAGLGGVIPIPDSFPSLWVNEEELGLARAALARWEAESVPGTDWTCSCGEVNEGSFGSCWKCSTLRPS
jgi:hypothetical protein